MNAAILTINAGSSSVKFALYETGSEEPGLLVCIKHACWSLRALKGRSPYGIGSYALKLNERVGRGGQNLFL